MGASIWSATSTPLVPSAAYVLTEKFTATAGQTLFNLSLFTYQVGGTALRVFRNGQLMTMPDDYTETSSSSFTFASGMNVGDEIFVIGNTFVSPGVDATLRAELAATGATYGSKMIGTIGSAAGAAARTVESKLNESVSILDYIPVGHNIATTNCTPYIQAALDSGAFTVYGHGLGYYCTGNIVIKGGWKTLDMQGGTLTFVNGAPTYGVTIKNTTGLTAGEESKNSLVNAFIECSGLTSGGADNIGIYIHTKQIGVTVRNVVVKSVDGVGIYVDGALDAGQFNCPDKGTLQDVVTDQCDIGIYFNVHAQAELMSGWSLLNCYAPTCGTAFYIKGCAQFAMCGLSSESYVNYGLRIDDAGYGGGHVLSGAFFESSAPGAVATTYENRNNANVSVMLYKGATGVTGVDLLNTPAMTLGNATGISILNEAAVAIEPGESVPGTGIPVLLTTGKKGCKVSIFGGGAGVSRTAFSEWYLGSDAAGTATVPILIFEREAGVFTTTKGNAATINIYYAAVAGTEYGGSPIGYYLQNNARAAGTLFTLLSIKMLHGYN